MLLQSIFDRFIQGSPVAVMVRCLLEHALAPATVDGLFDQHAKEQYTRELLFSQIVDLMGQVVCGIRPSLNAAYQAQREHMPVSRTAVYFYCDGFLSEHLYRMRHVGGNSFTEPRKFRTFSRRDDGKRAGAWP